MGRALLREFAVQRVHGRLELRDKFWNLYHLLKTYLGKNYSKEEFDYKISNSKHEFMYKYLLFCFFN